MSEPIGVGDQVIGMNDWQGTIATVIRIDPDWTDIITIEIVYTKSPWHRIGEEVRVLLEQFKRYMP